ncbi:MAG: Spo0E family sporulation regulatory protein-aspartic acid phosphatase [Clostridiales bacterium]|nr:Spo0E family sporulation regulatory protein-aspartic acid phosphatase [Clostridiales bacterium]
MDIKTKIEIARNLLNNALDMNVSKEIIHRLSQIIDNYILAYYQERRELGANAEDEDRQ